MTKEAPLQRDLFTGELVDNRTRTQKRKDKQKQALRQGELFSQREMAQFGAKANPQIPLSPKTSLRLEAEDPRTPEEKERDRQREIERRTYRMPGILDAYPDEVTGVEELEQGSQQDPPIQKYPLESNERQE